MYNFETAVSGIRGRLASAVVMDAAHCSMEACCIGHPSPSGLSDVCCRASIFEFLQMDPRLQLAGMTKKKDEGLLKTKGADGTLVSRRDY